MSSTGSDATDAELVAPGPDGIEWKLRARNDSALALEDLDRHRLRTGVCVGGRELEATSRLASQLP